ncbi:uncharacterized protein LOC127622203 isoform X2 [Xyrauchen texanus]|uniref:uncharacterized protein LOC127622203 isoform X2 n=1 Tax=Xyrauchen texanus TaxID=154827 RepID=UPI002241F2AA|nr:uncharacterized protein LOC127622203 isoform X2 [Xyrauchen texanus]
MTVQLYTCLGLLFSFLNSNAGALVEVSKKVGMNVIFPCNNKVQQTNCNKSSWLSNDNPAIELVIFGKIKSHSSERTKRVSLMPDCSLRISGIIPGDEGCYACQQFPHEGGQKLNEDTIICLSINKDSSVTNNDDSSMTNNDDSSVNSNGKLLMTVIPSMLMVILLSVVTVIACLKYRRRAKKRISVVNRNNICNEHNDGEDLVTYTELNHNAVKPKKVYIEYQKTEYAVIKLS